MNMKWREALVLVVLFWLLHMANVTDALSYIARPMVIAMARLLGVDAYPQGSDIILGTLLLPWTKDCSGINSLILLWGVTLWSCRHAPFKAVSLVRLILALPVSMVINVFRILSLAAYRHVYYPNWESESLHYLIGFLWLLPFLAFFTVDFRKKTLHQWLDVYYLAAVLALLSPVVFTPGGSVVALSTLFVLAHNHHVPARGSVGNPWLWVWITGAVFLSVARMESLWLLWMLTCPGFLSLRLLRSWSGMVVLLGSVPPLAMLPYAFWVVLAALVFYLFQSWKPSPAQQASTPPAFSLAVSLETLLLVGLLFGPFVLPGILGTKHPLEKPPAGVMSRPLTFNSHQIRLPGQSADVALFWYGAFGDGRHHPLVSCMRFRGVVIEKTAHDSQIFVGDGKWMREFFFHQGQMKTSYPSYLWSSFSPFSEAGIHIIMQVDTRLVGLAFFEQESENLARRLFALYSRSERMASGLQTEVANLKRVHDPDK